MVKTLFSRAETLSSCALGIHEEHKCEYLQVNNYPGVFTDRVYCRASNTPPMDEQRIKKQSVVIPYIKCLSEAIKTCLFSC